MAKQQYMFQAGGDACGGCAALDGTISDAPLGPQHENCHCQSVPVREEDHDCPTIEGGDVDIETTGPTLTVSTEVTLTCCDGSTRGMSVVHDLGPMSLPIDDIIAALQDAIQSAADELMDEDCHEPGGGWVEDGEGLPA